MANSVLAAPNAEAWNFWNKANDNDTRSVDHSAWQTFLDEYVKAGTTDNTRGINLVDYHGVAVADRTALQGYLTQLATLDPRDLNRDEQLAYWINFYNALTVEVVLAHPRKGSILRMGKGFFSVGPWDDALVTIAGQPVTLNDIEHRILRPLWQDHRIHFAVNCASISCPNLAPQVYTAANVDALLSKNEQEYINHPRGVRFTDKGRLQVAQIFEWYQGDFANNESELREYLASHHQTLNERIRNQSDKLKYAYDWDLNRIP